MAAESERGPLPFEPKRKRKKEEKVAPKTAAESAPKAVSRSSSARSRPDTQIPEIVSQRMLKRMLIFAGIPTGLGVATFFVSYVLLVRHIVEIPNIFVLLTTLGCFGLGVLGLSYGALSASWDERNSGNFFGFEDFQANFGRLTQAWRESRQSRQTRSKKDN